jgi:hypothetical protein
MIERRKDVIILALSLGTEIDAGLYQELCRRERLLVVAHCHLGTHGHRVIGSIPAHESRLSQCVLL